MADSLLPIFPLGLVLFPGARVPLHIFEPRYKEMIGEAIQFDGEFGIVLAVERGIVNVGCAARVAEVVARHEDGRLDIIAEGQRRFEIRAIDQERSYLRGEVDFFDDDEPEAPAALRQRALEAWRRAFPNALPPDEDGGALSFGLARPIEDLEARQQLLQMRSEAERLTRLIETLPGVARQREIVERMRMLAPRNGHGKHLG